MLTLLDFRSYFVTFTNYKKKCLQIFVRDQPTFKNICIKRRIGVFENPALSIIAYPAAVSKMVYGATVYVKLQDDLRSLAMINCISAKSKVAPHKTTPVARLELRLILLISLVRSVIDIYKLRHEIKLYFCFTDLMVGLYWLHSAPQTLKPLGATAVTKVLKGLPAKCYHHVLGSDILSDRASRGLSPGQLITHPLWFTGSSWLCQDEAMWPITSVDVPAMTERLPETKFSYWSYLVLRHHDRVSFNDYKKLCLRDKDSASPHPLFVLIQRILNEVYYFTLLFMFTSYWTNYRYQTYYRV